MADDTEHGGLKNSEAFPSKPNNSGSNGHTPAGDELKRRVSISQVAIKADIEKKTRKVSNISNKSNSSLKSNVSTENANNGYVNPAFQSCPSGRYKKILVIATRSEYSSDKDTKQYIYAEGRVIVKFE